jgi:thymidylate kinase
MELAEDQVIRADLFSGPARVKKFEERSGYYRLEVTLEESGEFRSLSLTPEQLGQVERVEANPIALSSDPEEFFLLVEANRIRLAHQFDPMLAVSASQVDPLPHQIEAVYHYALEMPRLRFMIADDPGAGKTIMAGLILKEMQQRGLVKRVLVVAPGHLKYQWQRELKERFGASFRLIDRSAVRAHWGENVWAETPLAIASVDFLKQDDIKATLSSARWDMVIVDEAHKMSAYAYETKERTKIDKTKRYQVGEVLSEQTEHMLFLTATPHKGDEENFRLFLDLLRPGFFANEEMLKESVEAGENPLFIRRLKEDMHTFDGEPIFPPRARGRPLLGMERSAAASAGLAAGPGLVAAGRAEAARPEARDGHGAGSHSAAALLFDVRGAGRARERAALPRPIVRAILSDSPDVVRVSVARATPRKPRQTSSQEGGYRL